MKLLNDAVLPVWKRLEDKRSVAVTQGRIAQLLNTRGDRDEALRLLREGLCQRGSS